jgi:hypothetical protein
VGGTFAAPIGATRALAAARPRVDAAGSDESGAAGIGGWGVALTGTEALAAVRAGGTVGGGDGAEYVAGSETEDRAG